MANYSFQAQAGVSGGGLRALPGATVTVYQTGTTVRAAIFDVNGNALPNPGLADAYGMFVFTAVEGAYDVVATLGSFVVGPITIQVVLAPALKQIVDTNYVALASDFGVIFSALGTSRQVTLPLLSTMARGKSFPVADGSGNASANTTIALIPAGTDTINGLVTNTLLITNPWQILAPISGVTTWML